MIDINPKTTSVKEMYKLLVGAIVPRPIAFVSSIGSDGSSNLAPFSFFNGVSSNPPCLMFSCAASLEKPKKDTLRNIEETKEFVVNSANEWFLDALVQTGAEYPYGVNEMAEVGLTPEKSQIVKPPRVKEAAVCFECVLHKLVPIGDGAPGSAVIVIGEIVWVSIQEECFQGGQINLEKYRPISRLGGAGYGTIGEVKNRVVPRV